MEPRLAVPLVLRPLAIGNVANEREGEPLATLTELSYADLHGEHGSTPSAVTLIRKLLASCTIDWMIATFSGREPASRTKLPSSA